jgi:ectoine hydroxylase-related dioxygenase (phytanoyl-CoA dioxygenase family)
MVDVERFREEGYVIVPDVISAAEVTWARPMIEAWLPADRPAPGRNDQGSGPGNGRKQPGPGHVHPALANLAFRPAVIRAAQAMLGPYVRVQCTSIPVATHKSAPGHENFGLGYHVDWPHVPPHPGDERIVNCVIHINAVQTGGGALMVCPGSHRYVHQHLHHPTIGPRMLAQDFTDLPGLPTPVEALAPAGSAVFFDSFLVHDRSENVLDTPRLVVFAHFKGYDSHEHAAADAAHNAARFAPEHVATMDEPMKRWCGLSPTPPEDLELLKQHQD